MYVYRTGISTSLPTLLKGIILLKIIAETKEILKRIRRNKGKKEEIREIIDFVKAHGGLEYAKEKMLEYRTEALNLLHSFRPSDHRDAMEELLYFVTDRKK